MPFSTKSLVRFTAKLTRCLTLALLPALATEACALSAPQRKQAVLSTAKPAGTAKDHALPYLAALGPLPLRFARPGPEPTAEPPDSPVPKVVEPIVEKTDPAKPADSSTKTADPAKPAQPSAEPTPESAPKTQPALPILPDDTQRELRPEDVLLYFRYPTSSASENPSSPHVIVPFTPAHPQSAPQPPSSATYEQK